MSAPFSEPLIAPFSRAISAIEAPFPLLAAPRPTCRGLASPGGCRPGPLGCAAQETPSRAKADVDMEKLAYRLHASEWILLLEVFAFGPIDYVRAWPIGLVDKRRPLLYGV